MNEENIKKIVRDRYTKVAKTNGSCCSANTNCCTAPNDKQISKLIGYSQEEISEVPQGANLGLGCGNPTALATLKEGEKVMDMGSGAGFDCFLAAKKVGQTGKVIGIDMTSEMIDKARLNAKKGNYTNVEFRLGEIENLPSADNSVDVVISNCVINLSPDKKRVFKEAYRVLTPNGRLMVSDIVLFKPLPEALRQSVEAYVGCIAGAELKNKYLELIHEAGFQDVQILQEKVYPLDRIISAPETNAALASLGMTVQEAKQVADLVVSISVLATKR